MPHLGLGIGLPALVYPSLDHGVVVLDLSDQAVDLSRYRQGDAFQQ